MNRRTALQTLGTAGLLGPLLLSGGCTPQRSNRRPPINAKVVVLGFDGVEPKLFEKWMAEGALPHLEALSRRGSYSLIRSTNPPQSPVAWSTFATGLNPGDHGIFDFIHRDPLTHLPDFALNRITYPQPKLGILPGGQLQAENLRRGTPFWVPAADNGVRVCALQVPYAFPTVTLPGGRSLTGLGTPDLRGTNSTFFYYGSNLQGPEEEVGVSGGRLFKLSLQGDRAESIVPGPPMKVDDRYLTIPIHFERTANGVKIMVSDQQWIVPSGEWSPWTIFRFPVTSLWSIRGIGKFLVLEDKPNLRVYLTPIGTHPVHSFIPISDPEEFAEDIQREQGYFSTVGWSHDTSAVDAGILPDGCFLRQVLDTMDFEKRLWLSQLEKQDWDLLIGVDTATDRAAHMFWRYLDPHHPCYDPAEVERLGQPLKVVYQKMDEMVGQVLERINDDVRLIVLSDHGFHAFRRGFHVNSWLVQQGLMAFRGLPEQTMPDQIPEDSFFPNVDWRRTKAYALGTGAVYLNLKGREQQGTVSPGEEISTVLQTIRNGLQSIIDPVNNTAVFSGIYLGSEIFKGSVSAKAPDLQLAYADAYRGSVKTLLGGFGKDLLEDNRDRWSGDHSASDVNDTSGIFLTNCNIDTTKRVPLALVDIAPTILGMFGLTPPSYMVGSKIA